MIDGNRGPVAFLPHADSGKAITENPENPTRSPIEEFRANTGKLPESYYARCDQMMNLIKGFVSLLSESMFNARGCEPMGTDDIKIMSRLDDSIRQGDSYMIGETVKSLVGILWEQHQNLNSEQGLFLIKLLSLIDEAVNGASEIAEIEEREAATNPDVPEV